MAKRFTDSQIRKIRNMLLECGSIEGFNRFQRDLAISYLARRPHILFCEGYDEARIFSDANPTAQREITAYLNTIEKGKKAKSKPFTDFISHAAILRNRETGEWEFLYYIWGEDIANHEPLTIALIGPNNTTREIGVDQLLSHLTEELEPNRDHAALVLPRIWVPPQVSRDKIILSSVTFELIQAIGKGHASLSTLTWRELEEVVAELLHLHGLEVRLTKPTRDGGRDIVATGELFPGLKSTLAVEVTKAQRVGIAKVSQALYRNRHYPTVMVATSGRFTAGVLQEGQLPENRMRLVLRDGDALHRWISEAIQYEDRCINRTQ